MTTFKLRDYQEAAVNAASNFIKYQEGHGYIKAPGGSGKSVMIAKLAERLYDLGLNVVILARSEKLIRQNREKLDRPYGTYSAGIGEKDAGQRITVGTIQSLEAIKLPHKPDVALVDECDEIHPDKESDTQYWKFLRLNGLPRIVGFTATDFRTASGPIQWGEKIIDIPIAPLFKNGYLVPPVNKVGAEVDLSQVKISMGEYNQEQLAMIYEDPELLRISTEKIIKYGSQRNRSIIFCQSLMHCDIIAHSLEKNGESCRTVSGETPKDELSEVIFPAHEAGEFKHLVNCQLLNVGVDLPWVDMIVMLMATKSKRKFEQCVYRGTRLYEGKSDFLALDMGMNFSEHGPLGSPLKAKKKREAQVKKGRVCPDCEEWLESATAEECPACGYVFEKIEPSKVTHSYEEDRESKTYYNHEGPQIHVHEVKDVTFKSKKSKNGNEMIVVEYHCDYGKYGTIAEFLLPFHDNDFVRNKVVAFFRERGNGAATNEIIPLLSMPELIHECEKLDKPSHIMVDHGEEFPRIKSVRFDRPKEQIDPEELLDDEIPF